MTCQLPRRLTFVTRKFFAEVHEDAFDKLTMLIQQCFSFLRLALCKPSFIANYYDALNNRIRNLRDPSQAQDAATKIILTRNMNLQFLILILSLREQ